MQHAWIFVKAGSHTFNCSLCKTELHRDIMGNLPTHCPVCRSYLDWWFPSQNDGQKPPKTAGI